MKKISVLAIAIISIIACKKNPIEGASVNEVDLVEKVMHEANNEFA